MPIDWKSPEAYTRLLAAIVASQDQAMKLDYRRIATMYGEGATYDSIEGRFRIIKKEAAELKKAVDLSDLDTPPKKAKAPRKPRAPKIKTDEKVKTGRVTKSAASSPTKGKKAPSAKEIKAEADTEEFVYVNGQAFPAREPPGGCNLGWGDVMDYTGQGLDYDDGLGNEMTIVKTPGRMD